MSRQPTGAAFDIVLLLHVACVVVGLATAVTGAATASRLRTLMARAVPLPEATARYFRAGINWAGRTIYGIPVFGLALLGLSQGAYALRDGWVLGGLAVFGAMLLVAEGLWFPAEQRLQHALAGPVSRAEPPDATVLDDVNAVARAATVCVVLLLAGSALMIAQP